jgi:sporulation protein YlmC with PRC-barrel domain
MDTATRDPNLILASRIEGTRVYNAQGEHLGHIEDLSIEKQTGIVRYGLISFGGLLGLGDRIHPVPWSLLHYDVGQAGYVVPLTKDKLKDAPHYTAAELEAFGGGDVSYRKDVFSYYGMYGAIPYW